MAGENNEDTTVTEVNPELATGVYVDGVLQPVDGKADQKESTTNADGSAKPAADKGGRKGDGSAQGRIDQAVGRQREAERQRDEALAALNATRASTAAAPAAKPALVEPDPAKYEGGELDVRYIRDLARYEGKKAAAEEAEASRVASVNAANAAEQTVVNQRTAAAVADLTSKGSALYDDFEAVVIADTSLQISPAVAFLATESSVGAQIMYELAKDRATQREVYAMSPAKQAAWFGRREAAVEAADEQAATAPPRNAPKAPAPPNDTSRGSGGTSRVSAATTNFKEFEAMAQPPRK